MEAAAAASPLFGYVEVSLSWSTILSSSSILLSSAFCTFVISFNFASSYGSVVACDLVVLWLVASSVLALSSIAASLPTISATTLSRWIILFYCSLFRLS